MYGLFINMGGKKKNFFPLPPPPPPRRVTVLTLLVSASEPDVRLGGFPMTTAENRVF